MNYASPVGCKMWCSGWRCSVNKVFPSLQSGTAYKKCQTSLIIWFLHDISIIVCKYTQRVNTTRSFFTLPVPCGHPRQGSGCVQRHKDLHLCPPPLLTGAESSYRLVWWRKKSRTTLQTTRRCLLNAHGPLGQTHEWRNKIKHDLWE